MSEIKPFMSEIKPSTGIRVELSLFFGRPNLKIY